MINRGWMPHDLKHFRYDRSNNNISFTGVLYRGDAETKYSRPNQPGQNWFNYSNPREMAALC
jgi:hypothetical protein